MKNSMWAKFDEMIADAPDESSDASSSSEASKALNSDDSDVLTSGICSSISLEFCNSEHSVPSMPSMPSMYTWEALASAERAKQDAKSKLPIKIRKWYDDWIESIYQADIDQWQKQITDMIGKHLIHATGKQNTLALVAAFRDVNESIFSIPRDEFINTAEKIVSREIASWIEDLPHEEAGYYKQLTTPQQEAFRICRALALRQLMKSGNSTFFLGANELGTRISVDDRRAANILKGFPFLKMIEKGKPWQSGQRAKATSWQWIYPLGHDPVDG